MLCVIHLGSVYRLSILFGRQILENVKDTYRNKTRSPTFKVYKTTDIEKTRALPIHDLSTRYRLPRFFCAMYHLSRSHVSDRADHILTRFWPSWNSADFSRTEAVNGFLMYSMLSYSWYGSKFRQPWLVGKIESECQKKSARMTRVNWRKICISPLGWGRSEPLHLTYIWCVDTIGRYNIFWHEHVTFPPYFLFGWWY